MLIDTAEGQRSIDAGDVVIVYRDDALGEFCDALLIMITGRQIFGRCPIATVGKIELILSTNLTF